MNPWLEILKEIVVALGTSLVMLKITTWLARKSRVKYWTVGKTAVEDGSVIKGGWLRSTMVTLAKWITSTSD